MSEKCFNPYKKSDHGIGNGELKIVGDWIKLLRPEFNFLSFDKICTDCRHQLLKERKKFGVNKLMELNAGSSDESTLTCETVGDRPISQSSSFSSLIAGTSGYDHEDLLSVDLQDMPASAHNFASLVLEQQEQNEEKKTVHRNYLGNMQTSRNAAPVAEEPRNSEPNYENDCVPVGLVWSSWVKIRLAEQVRHCNCQMGCADCQIMLPVNSVEHSKLCKDDACRVSFCKTLRSMRDDEMILQSEERDENNIELIDLTGQSDAEEDAVNLQSSDSMGEAETSNEMQNALKLEQMYIQQCKSMKILKNRLFKNEKEYIENLNLVKKKIVANKKNFIASKRKLNANKKGTKLRRSEQPTNPSEYLTRPIPGSTSTMPQLPRSAVNNTSEEREHVERPNEDDRSAKEPCSDDEYEMQIVDTRYLSPEAICKANANVSQIEIAVDVHSPPLLRVNISKDKNPGPSDNKHIRYIINKHNKSVKVQKTKSCRLENTPQVNPQPTSQIRPTEVTQNLRPQQNVVQNQQVSSATPLTSIDNPNFVQASAVRAQPGINLMPITNNVPSSYEPQVIRTTTGQQILLVPNLINREHPITKFLTAINNPGVINNNHRHVYLAPYNPGTFIPGNINLSTNTTYNPGNTKSETPFPGNFNLSTNATYNPGNTKPGTPYPGNIIPGTFNPKNIYPSTNATYNPGNNNRGAPYSSNNNSGNTYSGTTANNHPASNYPGTNLLRTTIPGTNLGSHFIRTNYPSIIQPGTTPSVIIHPGSNNLGNINPRTHHSGPNIGHNLSGTNNNEYKH